MEAKIENYSIKANSLDQKAWKYCNSKKISKTKMEADKTTQFLFKNVAHESSRFMRCTQAASKKRF